ncbi:unnamed protein product [Owenia fusiformis]|uniref:Uncharacterized protein n=1 Tax=Owenia fusiformis TaxID=6347 RepID=A0A8J1T4R5_OWEFU|nr:unnamed protein product [Owenia fusiformis]
MSDFKTVTEEIESVLELFKTWRIVHSLLKGSNNKNTNFLKEDDKSGANGKKVVCKNTVPITSVEQIYPENLAEDRVLQLDLSNNAITMIRADAFSALKDLQKLDLSSNQISLIDAGAFRGLDKLERLILTGNRLGTISSSIFQGLNKLTRLSLSDNQLKTIPEGAFDTLPELARLDFNSEYLMCDCNLQWIVKWSKENSVKIHNSTTCALPSQMKGQSVKKLKRNKLHCNWPVELSLFELEPSKSQVVFEGDKLPFECQASILDESTKMLWVRKGEPVEANHTIGIYVHYDKTPDETVLINRLVLEDLTVEHTGIWECLVLTQRGNISRDVNIIVISDDVLFCPAVNVETNKGTFMWPKSVSGVVKDLPCHEGRASHYMGASPPKAFYKCTDYGYWEDLDIDQCQYKSEMTRVLEQYTMMSFNISTVLNKAKKLVEYLKENTDKIQDSKDIVFLSQIVDKLNVFLALKQELGGVILNILSVIMDVDEELLLEAQKSHQACQKMVKALERMPKQLLSRGDDVSLFTDNIALEARTVNTDRFGGITCYVQSREIRSQPYGENSFLCSIKTIPKNTKEIQTQSKNLIKMENFEASISLPSSVFSNIRKLLPDTDASSRTQYKLQFIVYKNSKLFPLPPSAGKDVAMSVISSKILELSTNNLSDPVVVRFTSSTDGIAAYWDFKARGGLGDWLTNGCKVTSFENNITTIHCTHLSNLALLKRPNEPMSVARWLGIFILMEPAIYAGSLILVIALMICIITHIACRSYVKLPKKLRHSLVNICISILLLCISFTLGVNRMDHVLLCQIVGIAIHYFSICTLFWISITSNNLYKQYTKAERPPPPEPDPLTGPLPPKPIMRFYLLGWGVAIIICGITAAVNIEHYSGVEYCFLGFEPSLGAFYGPVGLLVAINFIFFIRISCVVKGTSKDTLDNTTETVELHENEIEMMSPDAASCNTHTNNTDVSIKSGMDPERQPLTQLHGIVVLLFLYLFLWVSGAFAVSNTFRGFIPHQQLIFSYVYTVSAAILAIFILSFYVFGRGDVRLSCRMCCCCSKRVIYELQPNTDTVTTVNHGNGHMITARAQSHTSLDSNTNTNKSSTLTNGIANRAPGGEQRNNKTPAMNNLVPSQTGTMTEPSLTSIPEQYPNFYNPRQNGVAKKYWIKKQKAMFMREQKMRLLKSSQSESDKNKRNSLSSDANTHSGLEIQIQKANENMQNHLGGNIGGDVIANGYQSPGNHSSAYSSLSANGHNSQNVQNAKIEHNLVRNTGAPPQYNDLGPPEGAQTVAMVTDPLLGSPVSPNRPPIAPKPTNNLPHISKKSPGMEPVSPLDRDNTPTPVSHPGTNLWNITPTDSQLTNSTLPIMKDNLRTNVQSPTSPVQSISNNVVQTPTGGTYQGVYQPDYGIEPYMDPQVMYEVHQHQFNNSGTENFLNELELRIPQNHHSTAVAFSPSRSEAIGETPYKHTKHRHHESDTQSDSMVHRGRGHHHRRHHRSHHDSDSSSSRHHHHHKHRHHKMRRQKSLDWEDQFKNKEKNASGTVPYVFVDRKYEDHLVQKALRDAHTGRHSDTESAKHSWFPRSVSAYEQVSTNTDLVTDSSSSSEDDDNVWVLQQEKEKFKKETSV